MPVYFPPRHRNTDSDLCTIYTEIWLWLQSTLLFRAFTFNGLLTHQLTMTEQSLYHQDAFDYPPRDSVRGFDIRAYKSEYLSICVGFAQSHGIYPDSLRHQRDTSLPYGNPRTLSQPFNQHPGTIIGHQPLGPGQLDSKSINPYISNTFVGPIHTPPIHVNALDR